MPTSYIVVEEDRNTHMVTHRGLHRGEAVHDMSRVCQPVSHRKWSQNPSASQTITRCFTPNTDKQKDHFNVR